MKQLVVSWILADGIRRGSRKRRICIPSWRAKCSRVCKPGKMLPLVFKHSIMMLARKFNLYFHFKEINKTSNSKRNEDVSPVCRLQAHDGNHHSKHYQHTSVAPKKAQRLDGVIKNLLPFLYRLNLHVLLIYIFYKFIIPIQFLKIHVFRQDKEEFSLYSGNVTTVCIGKIYL